MQENKRLMSCVMVTKGSARRWQTKVQQERRRRLTRESLPENATNSWERSVIVTVSLATNWGIVEIAWPMIFHKLAQALQVSQMWHIQGQICTLLLCIIVPMNRFSIVIFEVGSNLWSWTSLDTYHHPAQIFNCGGAISLNSAYHLSSRQTIPFKLLRFTYWSHEGVSTKTYYFSLLCHICIHFKVGLSHVDLFLWYVFLHHHSESSCGLLIT